VMKHSDIDSISRVFPFGRGDVNTDLIPKKI